MKNLLLFLLVPVISFCQGKSTSKVQTTNAINNRNIKVTEEGFVVIGTVQGVADGEAKITSIRGDQTIAAAEIKGGNFVLKGSVPEPALYWLVLGKEQPRYLFLENTSIKISGSKSDIKNLKVEGSANQKDFALFEKTFNPLFAALNAVVMDLNRAGEGSKPALIKRYNEALLQLDSEVEKFIGTHPSSYVSLFVLSVTMQSNENVLKTEQRFNSLSDAVKKSTAATDIVNYISYAKVGSIGSDALEFTQNNISDKPVSLSSLRGKYVLVDFWASWCRPCRQENPNVVKVFNKFKSKNFTVLGVSLDQQKEAWVRAIEKDNLTWTHVSDLQQWNNAVAQLYRVQSIPQNFLIDPAGKIVAKDLKGEDLEKKLCEYLGCSN